MVFQADHALLEYYHLFSPFFRFYNDGPSSNDNPSSTWQDEFRTTWNHLQQRYGYFNNINFTIRTDFYLDPACSLAEFKQISQASIHFEQVLQVMMANLAADRSEAARATETRFMRETPGQGHLSRSEATMAVQSMTSFRELFALRQDMSTCNTWAISLKPYTYEPSYAFRVAPQSQTVNDAIQWSEFAMSFVEASLSCALPQLQRLPPNHAGLNRFLAGRNRGTESMYDRNTVLTRRFEAGPGRSEREGDDLSP